MTAKTWRIVLFVLALAPLARAADVTVTWKGKSYTAEKLPDALEEAPKRAVAEFAPWAKERGYRFDLDPTARVLLVSKRGSTPDARLRTLAKVEAWFDALFPAIAKGPATGPAAPEEPKDTGGGIPEDPEAPPPDAGPTSKPKGGSAGAWGSGSTGPDAHTSVMLVVRDAKDYGALIDALAATRPYLASWQATAKKLPAFVLEEPLCGAYLEKADGQEEWSPEHELVNRTAQLLVLRRFGQQPNWLVQGLGWEAEHAYDGTMYCFPFRDEFVFAAEHGAWPNELANAFADRAEPLRLQEVASWPRGRYEPEPARLAWGLVHHLARTSKAKLGPLLDELRRFRDEHDRRSTGDATWERIAGYEVPVADQQTILEKHLGPDFLKTATEAFKKPGASAKSGERTHVRPRD